MKVVRSKKIKRLFNSKIWPFTVKSIVIYNMAGASVYCEIEGKNYALNGFAHDTLKLPHIWDSGHVLIDQNLSTETHNVYMSISGIIEKGLKLFSEAEINHLRSIGKGIKLINKS